MSFEKLTFITHLYRAPLSVLIFKVDNTSLQLQAADLHARNNIFEKSFHKDGAILVAHELAIMFSYNMITAGVNDLSW